MLHEDLKAPYLSAVYEIDLPVGVARFRIGDSLRCRPFALLTAYNPGRARPGPIENVRANERLAAAIRARGYGYATARGRSPDGAHAEPSFAVFDIPFKVALHLAREFGQAAFVWFDGETTSLAWGDERVDGGAT